MDRREKILKSRKFVRHKKKNWRKHCDITDIEEWLEEKRKQEASGCIPASEKRDEELFQIDQDLSSPESQKKREQLTLCNLKSERYAYPDPTVSPVLPNPVKRKGRGGKMRDSLTAQMETDENNILDSSDEESYPKELIYSRRSKALAKAVRRRKYAFVKKRLLSERVMDIWNNEGCSSSSMAYNTVKRPGVSKRSLPKSVSGLLIPHPGNSYNPEYSDHQRLLKKALDIEMKKNREEEKLKRTLVLPKMTAADRENQWKLEMLEGLLPSNSQLEDAQEGEENGSDAVILRRPIKASNRKTRQQKRKERLTRIALRVKRQKHDEKVRMDEVYRIRSLKKEIKQKKELVNAVSERRQEQRKKRDLKRTKRLGKHPYEAPPINFKLSDEIAGSLRLLEAEGNNARDRYSSILKRNIVAPKGRRTLARYHKHKPNVRWVESRAYNLRPDQMEI